MRLYLLFARWKVFLVDNTRSELCEVVETKVIVHSSHTMWNRGFISWSESESEHPNIYVHGTTSREWTFCSLLTGDSMPCYILIYLFLVLLQKVIVIFGNRNSIEFSNVQTWLNDKLAVFIKTLSTGNALSSNEYNKQFASNLHSN